MTSIIISAVIIGFLHTVTGPDHYLPFVALARARRWTSLKLALITAICGVGHVLSSVIIGLSGILLGMGINRITAIEGKRGDIAAWLLFGFGIAYMLWGLRQAWKKRHPHFHEEEEKPTKSTTFWTLFIIFVLGPCEPLIPLIMYPAAKGDYHVVFLIGLLFGLITVATMLSVVLLLYKGFQLVRLGELERFTHAIAGFIIVLSASSVLFLGL